MRSIRRRPTSSRRSSPARHSFPLRSQPVDPRGSRLKIGTSISQEQRIGKRPSTKTNAEPPNSARAGGCARASPPSHGQLQSQRKKVVSGAESAREAECHWYRQRRRERGHTRAARRPAIRTRSTRPSHPRYGPLAVPTAASRGRSRAFRELRAGSSPARGTGFRSSPASTDVEGRPGPPLASLGLTTSARLCARDGGRRELRGADPRRQDARDDGSLENARRPERDPEVSGAARR